MHEPRSVKSNKSRLTTINQNEEAPAHLPKVHSHFLVPSEKLDKVTRRVIAPYAQIERKGMKEEEAKEGRYLDMNRFNVFLEDTVDLDSLLYETAMVLKTVTHSSGVFVYIVDPVKNEIVLMPHNTKIPERHEVNIPIGEGKVAAAHAAFTKEFLLLEDVQHDRRFAEGLKWVDAKVALCMPVIKPDGQCYAVLELYRTHCDPYTDVFHCGQAIDPGYTGVAVVHNGKVAAAHAAFTKEFLLLEDVQHDRRFAEGLKWVDAKVALCMPVIKPDGQCYAVLELYRTHCDPYTDVFHCGQAIDLGYTGVAVVQNGIVATAHAAFTKVFLLLEDVQHDRRFAEGLKWVDAKVALCMPVIKPDGHCYAVLKLYRTHCGPYTDNVVYTVVSVACWAGAAVHQAQARITLQKTGHLNNELRSLLQSYFCDLASIDTMLTDMLAIVKSFMGAMRSSFFIVDKDHIGEHIQADMWDDGWATERTNMPKKKQKINLSQEQTPAGLVARTGTALNVRDAYKDPRFSKEIDPTTGTVVRSCLVSPIMDKHGVIGVVQLTNKNNAQPFNEEDELIFNVFVSYCSLIVHFYNMQQKKIYHDNMNKVYYELMQLHLKPCHHDFEELMETNGIILPANNFKTFDYHISEGSREEMPGLVCFMYMETFADHNFERNQLADFSLTILRCYRNNPYHNAEHAFCFTHTMYLILTSNSGYFDFVETVALMLAGLCHDLDHPGYNNNFLSLCKHPLAHMYKSSMLEYHHYFLAKKIIEDKNILGKLSTVDRERIMEEIKYDILCTDLAVYFQIRATLTPLVADHSFDWSDNSHRKMLKGILMTTSDLSGCCKPFGVAKYIAEAVYEEFYNQGDRERAMGYTPLSMMDRRRSINQPAEQIQFLSVVVLPCLLLLQNIFPNTSPLIDKCRKTQEAWREEIEIRGQKLWRPEESVSNVSRNRFYIKNKSEDLS